MNVLALLASTVTLISAPAPIQQETIRSALNVPFQYNGLTYTVTSARDGLKSYQQRHDQRQSTLSPGFKTEALIVFEMVVENSSDRTVPFTDLIPALTYGDGSVTDHAQWDVEQRSMVRTTDDTHINPQDLYSYTLDPVSVAPGGKAHFAVAFSHPNRSKAIFFSLQPGRTIVSSGVLITQPTVGPTVVVPLG